MRCASVPRHVARHRKGLNPKSDGAHAGQSAPGSEVVGAVAQYAAGPPAKIQALDLAKRGINSERLKDAGWDLIVVDEAHRLKNNTSIAYNFIKRIPSKYLLLLTATPLQNNLRELYNLVELLRPGFLGTWNEFRRAFISDRKGRSVKDHVRYSLA